MCCYCSVLLPCFISARICVQSYTDEISADYTHKVAGYNSSLKPLFSNSFLLTLTNAISSLLIALLRCVCVCVSAGRVEKFVTCHSGGQPTTVRGQYGNMVSKLCPEIFFKIIALYCGVNQASKRTSVPSTKISKTE